MTHLTYSLEPGVCSFDEPQNLENILGDEAKSLDCDSSAHFSNVEKMAKSIGRFTTVICSITTKFSLHVDDADAVATDLQRQKGTIISGKAYDWASKVTCVDTVRL
ncbi:hypothetical protein IAQ61_011883 [Plenodomus lingam]|nr:hypothetical protein IAQ61_011883 [Plenodomus lingam]